MSCSLLFAGLALAADYGSAARRLQSAPSDKEKSAILRELYVDPTIDAELQQALSDFVEGQSYAITIQQAQKMVELRAFAEEASRERAPADAGSKAKKIKENPLFRDPGDKEESNWFSKGFESLGEYIRRALEALSNREQSEAPELGGAMAVLGWLKFLIWGVFIALVAGFLYFVFRHFSWKRGLERKAKAMLDVDEPELSRDEYLAEADRLSAAGQYREAVRYLYLACLLVFDENGVGRFIRGQTNWEHLRRLEASEKMPSDLDFKPATTKFDNVWYGMRVQGPSDVESMRAWYLQVQERLRRKAA